MRLHIFNPSHDEALRADTPYYTPTAAARRLEQAWALLPLIWAKPGDCVLIPDGATIPEAAKPFADAGIHIVCDNDLTPGLWEATTDLAPWGRDKLLAHRLRRLGAPEPLLCTSLCADADLKALREHSSRRATSKLMEPLKGSLTDNQILSVGDSAFADSEEEVRELQKKWGDLYVKSPWSCSGRGVFPLPAEASETLWQRVRKLLAAGEGIEVQKALKPVMNFALEFVAAENEVAYLGPSIFKTGQSGGYISNRVADVPDLEAAICKMLPIRRHKPAEGSEQRFASLVESLASRLKGFRSQPGENREPSSYTGPFGIDMMIAETPEGNALCPMIEINLRRTMGHVALALGRRIFPDEDGYNADEDRRCRALLQAMGLDKTFEWHAPL